jgi:hypothetical protein
VWPSFSSFSFGLQVVEYQWAEPELEVVVGEVEPVLQLLHLTLELVERTTETLDLVLVERARFDPAQRLALEKLPQELYHRQDESDEPVLHPLAAVDDLGTPGMRRRRTLGRRKRRDVPGRPRRAGAGAARPSGLS